MGLNQTSFGLKGGLKQPPCGFRRGLNQPPLWLEGREGGGGEGNENQTCSGSPLGPSSQCGTCVLPGLTAKPAALINLSQHNAKVMCDTMTLTRKWQRFNSSLQVAVRTLCPETTEHPTIQTTNKQHQTMSQTDENTFSRVNKRTSVTQYNWRVHDRHTGKRINNHSVSFGKKLAEPRPSLQTNSRSVTLTG